MRRLRQEITSVVGASQCPDREQIRKMAYLGYVIKESQYYVGEHNLK